jgi:hypothetical protein
VYPEHKLTGHKEEEFQDNELITTLKTWKIISLCTEKLMKVA